MITKYRSLYAAGGLALFVLLLYARLLLTNQVLADGDILHYFYPYRDYAAEAIRQGRIPLWNPYIFLGVPFLANPQAAVLYPFHWPLSWLPVTKQIYWSAAFHTWLLGFGGYRLMRRYGLSVSAAMVTGLVLAGSGFYGGLIGHINQMNGAAWLPWSILALEAKVSWRRSIGLLALCTALMILAGHTQTLYINLFGLGLWVLLPDLSSGPLKDLNFFSVRNSQDLERQNDRTIDEAAQESVPQKSYKKWVRNGIGFGRLYLAQLFPRLGRYIGGVLLGILLSLAQLLPTLELSALGLRSEGLSYVDATSFSLRVLKLPFTLLPTYGLIDLSVTFSTLGYSEFVAYVGVLALLLAGTALWQKNTFLLYAGLLFVGAGFFLALGRWNPFYWVFYQLIPGFSLFRTPARWMMLYTLGMALLAGGGVQWIHERFERISLKNRIVKKQTRIRLTTLLGWLLIIGIATELILAARSLPHTHTTAPQAVTDVRTAPAHLLTDPQRNELHPAAAGRFLSMSTITFDPGDMADYRRVTVEEAAKPLGNSSFNQLIVALKSQEILAPNLSLLWRIPSVDGFDGGVLPLRRYIQALALFVPESSVVPDGRLREQVRKIPPAELLGLFNAQYLFTDKVADVWYEGIYFDRQIGARLGRGTDQTGQVVINVPYPFEATRLDLIGALDLPEESLPDWHDRAVTVAQVYINDTIQGDHFTWPLMGGGAPGAQWSDGRLDTSLAQSSGAQIAYQDIEDQRQEYVAHFSHERPWRAEAITITLALPNETSPIEILSNENRAKEVVTSTTIGPSGETVLIRGATLIDERTGMFLPLLPSDQGNFRRVHSGDVKIYENLDTLPRAYLAYEVQGVNSEQEAFAQLQLRFTKPSMPSAPVQGPKNKSVAATTWAIVEGLDSFQSQRSETDEVRFLAYGPERIELSVTNREEALLVLSDSYYPGWLATVDQQPTEIFATNGLFRSILLQPGTHQILFEYQPYRWRWGIYGTIGGFILLALCFLTLNRK